MVEEEGEDREEIELNASDRSREKAIIRTYAENLFGFFSRKVCPKRNSEAPS